MRRWEWLWVPVLLVMFAGVLVMLAVLEVVDRVKALGRQRRRGRVA